MSFNGAVTSSLRRVPGRSLCRKATSCFNGAVTSSLRRAAAVKEQLWDEARFNGAVTSSLRRAAVVAGVDGIAVASFNGAVTSSLRRVICRAVSGPGYGGLQWGRNFIVTESEGWGANRSPCGGLQWGRNFIVTESGLSLGGLPGSHSSFNGAVTSSLRRGNKPPMYNGHTTGFNGAVTSSLRRAKLGYPTIRRTCRLQWGRNFIVTERGPRERAPG